MNKSPLLWIGWCRGYPLRYSGYTRWNHAASLHLGPLCVQWRMPERKGPRNPAYQFRDAAVAAGHGVNDELVEQWVAYADEPVGYRIVLDDEARVSGIEPVR